jgi:hypothetical protein
MDGLGGRAGPCCFIVVVESDWAEAACIWRERRRVSAKGKLPQAIRIGSEERWAAGASRSEQTRTRIIPRRSLLVDPCRQPIGVTSGSIRP